MYLSIIIKYTSSKSQSCDISRLLNPMIVKQISSSRRLDVHPRYALGLLYLLLAALQPFVIKADLNGTEVCQNRCFNQSECDGVGKGLCCQWDHDSGQCISSIGSDICPGTANMSLPPRPSINCPLTEMGLVATSKTLSNIQVESAAPSTSSTSYDDRCTNILTALDFFMPRIHYFSS